MELIGWLAPGGRHLVTAFTLTVALLASGHAVIWKRDSRSAVSWVVVIWLMPLAGAVLYLLLGVNRIERRAAALRREAARPQASPASDPGSRAPAADAKVPAALKPLATLVDQLVPRQLLSGNRIEPLVDGAQAYPAMLGAIDAARTSVALSTYIFDREGAGERFIDALARAAARGVQVRVLIDDADVRFSWGSAAPALRQAGVPLGVFNPTLVPARLNSAHLRNHSKILVVDGQVGFTGGINIAKEYWHAEHDERSCRDLHFRIEGPAVAHLAEVFAADWQFASGEVLAGDGWFPALEHRGAAAARGIETGPDENFERLRWTILGALGAARESVSVVTPYFLPDPATVAALSVAAMSGVQVDIVLPERTDIVHVDWAVNAQLWQVLQCGCRVWRTPGPFDHSKLLLIDGVWSLFGSANWDARSLRLNFEFNVECYDAALGEHLARIVQCKRARARQVTLMEMDSRSLPVKLRDGIARLATPFL